MSDTRPPFVRVQLHEDDDLLGARWWQESMAISDPIARRNALLGIGAAVVTLGGLGALLSTCGPDAEESTQEALSAQRSFGWNVGSEEEALTFPGAEAGVFDARALDTLVSDLAPPGPLRPYYVPTLFQSGTAVPTMPAAAGSPGRRLRDVLRPIATPEMQRAEQLGQALASLFQSVPPGRAVLVDLPGPEAVAYAAGLADRLCPVFLFDNWPHPHGVVPAHLTLGAVLHYLPRLQKAAAARPASAPPVFVLDRNRLNPYRDESDRFDNRYLARVPSAVNLINLGIGEVLYVREQPTDQESDDLNADFVAWDGAGIKVRLVATSSFAQASSGETGDWDDPEGSGGGADTGGGGADTGGSADAARAPRRRFFYGGSPRAHWLFFSHYGWGAPPRPVGLEAAAGPAVSYRPRPRATIFGSSSLSARTPPGGFGKTRLYRESGSGRILGFRSSGASHVSTGGSWRRSSSGWFHFSGG